MKYEIPQDRLDKIIFKYLDNTLKGLEKKKRQEEKYNKRVYNLSMKTLFENFFTNWTYIINEMTDLMYDPENSKDINNYIIIILMTDIIYCLYHPNITKCYKLNKPFALLLGLPILNYQEIGEFFIDKKLQLLIFDKKLNLNSNTITPIKIVNK